MAGRPRKIDRDKVLDAAEAVVLRIGAGGLSIDAVAKEAGITKGGVQYSFGSKQNLIRAMVERWSTEFEKEVGELAGKDAKPLDVLAAHIEATRRIDGEEHSRSAALMAAVLESPDLVQETRNWYNSRFDGLEMESETARRARLAFYAGEGAFLLRALGLIDMTDAEWQSIFEDIGRTIGRTSGGR